MILISAMMMRKTKLKFEQALSLKRSGETTLFPTNPQEGKNEKTLFHSPKNL